MTGWIKQALSPGKEARAMAEAFDKLYTYITEYEFVQNALIVGVLIALCSSLLGVTLVLKRFSLILDNN